MRAIGIFFLAILNHFMIFEYKNFKALPNVSQEQIFWDAEYVLG